MILKTLGGQYPPVLHLNLVIDAVPHCSRGFYVFVTSTDPCISLFERDSNGNRRTRTRLYTLSERWVSGTCFRHSPQLPTPALHLLHSEDDLRCRLTPYRTLFLSTRLRKYP